MKHKEDGHGTQPRTALSLVLGGKEGEMEVLRNLHLGTRTRAGRETGDSSPCPAGVKGRETYAPVHTSALILFCFGPAILTASLKTATLCMPRGVKITQSGFLNRYFTPFFSVNNYKGRHGAEGLVTDPHGMPTIPPAPCTLTRRPFWIRSFLEVAGWRKRTMKLCIRVNELTERTTPGSEGKIQLFQMTSTSGSEKGEKSGTRGWN